MDTITVDIDGRIASFTGGRFTGDPDVVAAAHRAVTERHTVDIFERFPTPAETGTPLGVLAALCAFNPARVFITQLPAELGNWLNDAFEDTGCGAQGATGQ